MEWREVQSTHVYSVSARKHVLALVAFVKRLVTQFTEIEARSRVLHLGNSDQFNAGFQGAHLDIVNVPIDKQMGTAPKKHRGAVILGGSWNAPIQLHER